MAVNDWRDAADAESHWHELPPLRVGDLAISPDAFVADLEAVLCEGGFEACIRMEVAFGRKKGEYFASYNFGMAITPDSDEMVRIRTLGMIRLLVRTGAFRALYAHCDAAAAAALRAKVADAATNQFVRPRDQGRKKQSLSCQ